MADGDRQGGMRGNVGRLLDDNSPQTEEERIAYLTVADWLKRQGVSMYNGKAYPIDINQARGLQARGGPLHRLLSEGQKVPAERYGPNWPKGRHNPLTWLREIFGGAKVPGAREGQWLLSKSGEEFSRQRAMRNPWPDPRGAGHWGKQAGQFTGTPWSTNRRPWQQIGRDAHSIVSDRANRLLGRPMEGEALNSIERRAALGPAARKGLGRLALRGLPIVGSAFSAGSDAHRFYTDPTYTTPSYLLDQGENASWLGGWGTGLAGSGLRWAGERGVDAIGEGINTLGDWLSRLEEFNVGGVEWPDRYLEEAILRQGDDTLDYP